MDKNLIFWIVGTLLVALSFYIKNGHAVDSVWASGMLWGVGMSLWIAEILGAVGRP